VVGVWEWVCVWAAQGGGGGGRDRQQRGVENNDDGGRNRGAFCLELQAWATSNGRQRQRQVTGNCRVEAWVTCGPMGGRGSARGQCRSLERASEEEDGGPRSEGGRTASQGSRSGQRARERESEREAAGKQGSRAAEATGAVWWQCYGIGKWWWW